MRFNSQSICNARYNATGVCMFALTVVSPLFAGCNHGEILATNLPTEYVAPFYPSANQIDLSQLSNDTSDSDRLTAGDLVGVTITTGMESNPESQKIRVNDEGQVNVPIVGLVQVAGLTLDEAANVIRQDSIHRRKYVNPVVTVTLEKRLMHQVAIFGAVLNPGTYEIPANDSDLASAIAAAGGLSEEADTVVEIRKPRPNGSPFQTVSHQSPDPAKTRVSSWSGESVEIDLTRPDEQRRDQLDLIDGSIVMVKEKKPRSVFVTGMVKNSKQIEIPNHSELRLIDAITMAGGRSTPLAQKIKVIRTLEGQTVPVSIMTTYSEAKENGSANLRLAAGDVVSVEETPALVVFETLRSFINFGVGASVPVF